MSVKAILLHLSTVIVLAAGLSGLSVGLGACMPNFRESDPSKIAAGFGGTLNLVAGLLYLLLILGLMPAPWHAQMMLGDVVDLSGLPLGTGLAIVGTALGLTIGAVSPILAMRAGIRALREMEF
jgi:ABC-2 type transport system permease protein